MTLEEFDDQHGSVITTALAVYAEQMRATAQESRDTAIQMELHPQPEPEPPPGTISIRPTSGALRRMAAMFEGCAVKAEKALDAWRTETEGPDEDDAELLGIDPDGTHHFRV
jgi:hypothetical protein